MNQRLAQCIFIFLTVLSIPASIYPLYYFFQISSAVSADVKIIIVDNAQFYYLYMSIFLVLFLVQRAGLKSKQAFFYRYASALLCGTFILAIAAAYILPNRLHAMLVENHYQQCGAPDSLNRISKAQIMKYSKRGCR